MDSKVHRLIIWNSNDVSEKPLVLLKPGNQEVLYKDNRSANRRGTASQFTFEEAPITYRIEVITSAKEPSDIGTFLVVYEEGIKQSRERLTEYPFFDF